MNPGRVAASLGQRVRRNQVWRGRVYRLLLPGSVGERVRIGRNPFLDGLDRIEIGDGAVIADNVGLVARAPGSVVLGAKTFVNSCTIISSTGEGVRIGFDCGIGPNVTVVDQNHAFDDPSRPIMRQGMTGGGPVVIGDGSWVAAGTVILGPTNLAPGSVVGANSVVRGDFPRRCIVAGTPARVVRYLDEPGTDTLPSPQEG